MLSYSPGGNYYDGDKISATDIMIIDFKDDVDSPFEAVEYTEVDTAELHGETYNLEIIDYSTH